MSDVLFLDSGPLGLITQPQRSHEVIEITDWLKNCLGAGARVVVPAIVYYEIKRELLRANKTIGIARLDAFVNATPGRYVPLTDDPLRFAAELWAQSRQARHPTADTAALDIDVLLAAQGRQKGPNVHDAMDIVFTAASQGQGEKFDYNVFQMNDVTIPTKPG